MKNDYEILYDLPEGEFGDPGKGIRTRTIRAGTSLEVECFPILRPEPTIEREKQKRQSGEAQRRLNLRNARKRVMRLLEANFGKGDVVLHLTIRSGNREIGTAGSAFDDRAARKLLRNYLAKVKRRVKGAGRDPAEVKYLYVIESGKKAPARYHFHMVIHAPGVSRETLEELWPHGYANCDRLDTRGDGLAALAKYMTKQIGLNGPKGDGIMRRWSGSRNLKEPRITTSDRKVSRRRASLVAGDVLNRGAEIFERLYPGYRCAEPPEVRYSDFAAGAWIYARLRKIE